MKLKTLRYLLPLIPRLGLKNIGYVFWYRLSIKLGLRRLIFPSGHSYPGDFFTGAALASLPSSPASSAASYPAPWRRELQHLQKELSSGKIRYFAKHLIETGSPPDWFSNPFDKSCIADPAQHWTFYNDFNLASGDVKCLWEPSRMAWAVALARCTSALNCSESFKQLNFWLSHWVEQNPLNTGPNWKNGQEAAFRIFALLQAAIILGEEHSPSPALLRFVREHCSRIAPDISYALAQDNNHGTSEAAALFIGGAWLKAESTEPSSKSAGDKWFQQGRCLLEDLVQRLILPDGSFSQRSVNYHRVLLDTLCLAECFTRRLQLSPFTAEFYQRARAAVHWLFELVDPLSGGAPNLGANDGSLILPLSSCSYSDFRPSVQLAYALFFKTRAYPPGPWDEPLLWLGAELSDSRDPLPYPSSQQFLEGGYITLHGRSSWALVHAPRHYFRPSHADALHLDLWHKGINILCDSGSYSYNCEEPLQSYFPSSSAHNTAQFDRRGQMPRISRFLFGAWRDVEILQPLMQSGETLSWCGKFTDYRGAWHKREVNVSGDAWIIRDEVGGFRECAVLRWHLAPLTWELNKNSCSAGNIKIDISCDAPGCRLKISQAKSSLYYAEFTVRPVLEIVIENAPEGSQMVRIETKVRLAP